MNASNLSHRKDCELFYFFERESSLDLKFTYYRGVIAQVVKASIHLRRGAGGFSLSPSLSCIRVVSDDSPAFQLLRKLFTQKILDHTSQLVNLDNLIRKLHELFQDGQASPRDVNSLGGSLLHVSHLSTASTSSLTKHRIKDVSVYICFSIYFLFSTDEIGSFLEKLCRLGVPVHEVDDNGMYVPLAVNLNCC